MVLLLGSRGQYRGRNNSGFTGALRRVVDAVSQITGFGGGRSGRRSESRSSRGTSAGSWIALGGALACFGIGYLVGHSTAGVVPPGPGNGASSLKADGNSGAAPVQPAMMAESDVRPLANQAFVVAAYEMDAAEAKARAKSLGAWLRGQNLAKARPFEFPSERGPVWVVAVYYDGEAEQAETKDRLAALPADVPDEVFVRLRKDPKWPVAVTIPVR